MTEKTKPDWRRLFCHAIAQAGGVLNVVADEIGLSRTTVSLVAHGKYPSSTDKIAEAVIAAYDNFTCPHLGERVTPNACKANALRPAPTSSARDARHWRACQTCPNKPEKE